jgi:glycyl-tRNA synthetase beta chain
VRDCGYGGAAAAVTDPMPELLLEIFSEEIPARMQARAAADLERLVNERLLAAGCLPEGVKAFATPRRLALVASGLPIRQPDRKEEKKGPRVGAPAQAVEGFLKSAGLASLDHCEVREDKKGAYYVATIAEKGRDMAAVVAEFAPEIIRSFPWPKSMRWGAGELKWVRPIHSILCAFDNEIVPFAVDGLRSGDMTRGHRRMGGGEIRARNFAAYHAGLKSAKVILDLDERKALIAAEAKTLCAAQGLELIEDAGLLGEVAGLAEWPVVMIGSFDPKFLQLPDEVLSATMRGHQKYFSVGDPKTGRLAAKFVFVANLDAPDGGAAMRPGYERVLTARLSDAWYLYHQDLKVPLAARVQDLDRVTFFEGLGTVGDKARRVAELSKEIAPRVGADPQLAEEAARLAKADLVSAMVYEFPELQGIMGRYYARAQGVDAEIADAIRDHYRPKGAEDDVPAAPVSVAVALADRIDTLASFYLIDRKPTGSTDPFALRRSALGVISLLQSTRARLSLARLAELNLTGRMDAAPADRTLPRAIFELITFVADRLKVSLRERGYAHDRIDAVLGRPDVDLEYNIVATQPEDDLVLIVMKLEALNAFLKSDDGANLAAAYKRAANILKAEEKADGRAADPRSVAEGKLALAEEKALFAALTSAEEKAGAAVAAEKFAVAMSALSALRAPLDAFFAKVTVNATDAALRANRLALLARFRAAAATVADFSKLEG